MERSALTGPSSHSGCNASPVALVLVRSGGPRQTFVIHIMPIRKPRDNTTSSVGSLGTSFDEDRCKMR